MPEKQPEIKLTCPECSAELVIRTNRTTQEQFLGCRRYPTCLHTQPLTPYIKAKLAGHPTMF